MIFDSLLRAHPLLSLPKSSIMTWLNWNSTLPTTPARRAKGITVAKFYSRCTKFACCTQNNNSLSPKDEPMKDWLSHRQEYLDELFWHEGRGRASQLCPMCVVSTQGPRKQARYVCRDCSGSRLFCEKCIVSLHMENPFHNIRVCFICLVTNCSSA